MLSATLSALSDPTRRAILSRLAKGEATVTELAAPFHMSLPAISRHIKVLEQAGLITRGRDAQWRPCRLQVEPLKDIARWLERYCVHWEESFDRLEEYLREVQTRADLESRDTCKRKRLDRANAKGRKNVIRN
jgi:DNA-binding transcriptional ArsR family regulator